MRQLTWAGARRVEWRDVPAPRLQGAGEALVRPLAVARCDLDIAIVHGAYRNAPPFALGHEIAGEVVEIGDAVRTVAPGDRVVVPFQISCGDCDPCRLGRTNACTSVPPFAAYGLGTAPEGDHGGGLSDLVRVPFADAMLVLLPDGLSPAAACGLSDNVADGWRTVAPHLAARPGADVLVVGGGARSVGLYAVAAARALGAARVRFEHPDPADRAVAERLGADALEPRPDDRGAWPIVVDATATHAGTRRALRATAPCGVCTSVSGTDWPVDGTAPPLPLGRMYMLGITWEVSRVHGRTVLPEVMARTCCGELDPLAVGARLVAFDDAADAIGEPGIKTIFVRE